MRGGAPDVTRDHETRIFVFGSNEARRHGKGAAKFALNQRGAVYGQGHGLQGQSYAIPTFSFPYRWDQGLHATEQAPVASGETCVQFERAQRPRAH